MYLSGKRKNALKQYSKPNVYRDEGGFQAFYEPISVVEFIGVLTRTGQSNGHYISDIKDIETKAWFRTNDDHDPVEIPVSAASKRGYVVLFKRVQNWNK